MNLLKIKAIEIRNDRKINKIIYYFIKDGQDQWLYEEV